MSRIVQNKSISIFSRMISTTIFSSILILILGIVLLVLPELTNILIGIVLGTIIIFIGFTTIIKFFGRNGAKLYSYNFLLGILLIIIGVVSIIFPGFTANIVGICAGIFLILLGSLRLSYGIWFKIGNHRSWFITCFIGILIIIFGVLVMANPFEASKSLTQIIGIFFILSSILDITDSILIKKQIEDISEIFW